MECSKRIYTRRQWNNLYREWNEKKKKRKLDQKSGTFGFSGSGSSDENIMVIDGDDVGCGEASSTKSSGKKARTPVEKKREGSSGSDDDHVEEIKKNKRKNNRGYYTELGIESSDPHLGSAEKVVNEVDGNTKDNDKEEFGSCGGNVSSKDEYEDCDETFPVDKEEFGLQLTILEKADNQVEKSSKKEKEKANAADNLSIDSGEVYDHLWKKLGDESCGSLLNENDSNYYDDDYVGFLEKYCNDSGMSGNWVMSDNGEEEEDKQSGSDTFALSSDSNEWMEKQAKRKKKKQGRKGKENTDIGAGNVNPKAEKRVGKNKKEKMETDGNISPNVDDENDDALLITGKELVPHVKKREKEKKRISSAYGSKSYIEDYDKEKELVDESKDDLVKERDFEDNTKLGSHKNKCNVKDGGNHEGPAYRLRSNSVSKYETKETKLGNIRKPLLVSEDPESVTSSDEADKNDNCVKINVHKGKKKAKHTFKRRMLKPRLRNLDFKKILLNSILEGEDVAENKLHLREENIPGMLPLKFRFEDEDPAPPEKNKCDEEIEDLFVDLQTGLQELKDSLTSQPLVDDDNIISAENNDDAAVCCQKGKHFLVLDEQIGLMCKYCSFVLRERKYILPSFANKAKGRQGMKFFDGLDFLSIDGLPLDGADGNHCTSILSGGTVWDVLPKRTKETMYPHQREGFEFLWRNIAGDIHIENLKNMQSDGGNGCIISHAPGTGKTRLTIVFLQSFMKLFPECCPMIIAPRSMLLTWEEEFRKWDVDIPFHNLYSPTLSGRENSTALSLSFEPRSKEAKRLLKMYSWAKGSGILGITYRLFEQLVTVKENLEDDPERKILLNYPGVVVLDEGHIPRNDDSLIWKAVSELKTPRRIILSGTPFQNNFEELYNTLCLVCPKFSGFTPGRQLKSVRKRKAAKKKFFRLTDSIGMNSDVEVKELKKVITPLVHVHKGSILLERLPGLRSTLVYLKPTSLQQKLLCVIPQKKLFEEDYFMTLISVHPSLVKDLKDFSDYRSEVEQFELDPDAGVKTEFLFALIRLSDVCGEKVIVFSQYIAPMNFIKKQLESVFGWVEGREVLHMNGDSEVQRRQASINSLNDPKSTVKVLLASTRACCEGINLVGASRVVLLDAVWNPSIKRQAISRAYRLGQTKIVHAYQLISSTLEAKKYASQAKKSYISELIFSTHSKGIPCKRGNLPAVSEDKILETLVQHPKHGLMFDRLVHDPKESDLIDTFDFVE